MLERDFQDLAVWEKAHRLALLVYKVTEWFPQDERLTSQLRMTALNIPSNVAKGWAMREEPDLAIPCVTTAIIAADQLKAALKTAFDLYLLDGLAFRQLDLRVTEIKPMLVGLIQKIELGF